MSNQFKYYWVVVGDAAKYLGVPKNSLHTSLKKAKGIDSIKNLSKDALRLYILEIIAFFASEHGVELPLSEEGKTLRQKFEE